MLFVNELFYSVQGEGRFTGTPAVFVRLQGCRCQCPWCDTKFTWKLGRENGVTLSEILEKSDRPGYATVSEEELASHIAATWPQAPMVVVTGGEPCLFDLTAFCRLIEAQGRLVQIETSGTEPVRVTDSTYVTVSPKHGMPGGREVLPEALGRADEVKMVVGCQEDIETLDALLAHVRPGARLSLQPLSSEAGATALCFETVLERGSRYHLSLQTHKFINVR